MNCWIILLLLFCGCGKNKGCHNNSCASDADSCVSNGNTGSCRPKPCRPSEPDECDCGCEREKSCERNTFPSYGSGDTCGCDRD